MTSKSNIKRIKQSLNKVLNNSLSIKNLCFIHGDWHYGNLILDKDNKVIGVIDLDWCRIGYHLEDLAYTVMMLLRFYDSDQFNFNKKRFSELLDWYGLNKNEIDLFKEYLILYAFYDVCILKDAADLKNQKYYLNYQKSFLDYLCDNF